MASPKKAAWAVYCESISPWSLCFFLAYISSFFLSGRSVPLPNLDQSYQAVLEYAATNHFQFGKDIVFTFGPLGFLNTDVSQGLFTVQRILFALAWSGIVAWSATGLARQIPGRMTFVFLVWFLIYSKIGGLEQDAFLVMSYGCIILMGDVQKRKCAAVSFLVVFALLALVKFTLFMAVSVSVVLCSLVQLGNRNVRLSIAIVTFFGAIFIALWSAVCQRLENLLPWLRGSFEIAGGYTDAMTIFPKISVLAVCTVAGAMFLGSLWMVIRSARLSFSGAGILVVTSVYVFLSWKHGLVRADAHAMGFILFLPLGFSLLLNESFQKTMHRKQKLCLATLFMGVVLLCNWAADFQDPGTMLTKLIEWPRFMAGNSRLIMNSVTENWENCFEALQVKQQLKRAPDLPVARAIVGKASVDVINYTQWAALANNLNYRPRPVIQGYSVYTPYLQDLNISFYRSEKRPQFLLFNMETIDERFPPLDDATLLSFVLRNYKPIAKDGGFLVLQALPNTADDGNMTLLNEQAIAFGESLELPVCSNALLIMQVEIKPTFFGRVLKFIFQAPVVTLNIKSNGKTASYRFIPAMAERGFIVNPLLLTNNDVMHYYEGTAGNCTDSISFFRPKYSWGQLSDTIRVRMYESRSLPD